MEKITNKISDNIKLLSERKFIFADKKRLKKGKIYLPSSLISLFGIKEILAVIKKNKPAMEFNYHCDYSKEVRLFLEELKNIYGLKYKISRYKFLINSPKNFSDVVEINNSRKGMLSCSVSFDKSLTEKSEEYFLKKSYRNIESDEFSKKFAEVMGYPKCCIEFGNTLSGNVGKKGKEKENFVWSKAQIRSYMNSDSFSRLLNIFTLDNQLLSHTPCKLNCRESEKYAKKMFTLFKKEDIFYSQLIDYALNLHSLFWYYSEFILLEGKKKNNYIEYSDFLPISFSDNKFFGKLDKNFKEKFKKTTRLLSEGNKIKMEDNCFKIYKDNKLLGLIKKSYKFEAILF